MGRPCCNAPTEQRCAPAEYLAHKAREAEAEKAAHLLVTARRKRQMQVLSEEKLARAEAQRKAVARHESNCGTPCPHPAVSISTNSTHSRPSLGSSSGHSSASGDRTTRRVAQPTTPRTGGPLTPSQQADSHPPIAPAPLDLATPTPRSPSIRRHRTPRCRWASPSSASSRSLTTPLLSPKHRTALATPTRDRTAAASRTTNRTTAVLATPLTSTHHPNLRRIEPAPPGAH